MKIVCPNCGVQGGVELFLTDAAARQSVKWALSLPPSLATQILGYIGLFRPEKSALTWDRAEKLLGELREMIEAGTIRKQGRDWQVTVAQWQQSLDEMLLRRAKIRRPLKNHNYLLEILVELSDKAEACAERQREEQARSRPGAVTASPSREESKKAARQAFLRQFEKYNAGHLARQALNLQEDEESCPSK